MTLAELAVGPMVAHNDQERALRLAHLQRAESAFDPMPFDAAAAWAFAPIAARLRASGKRRAARAYDTLIAAVAISRNLSLYSHKPDDFSAISGLDLRSV